MSESSSYTTLTALQRERNKISPPPKHLFMPFIKPECQCDPNLPPNYNCEGTAFIPNLKSLSRKIYLEHGTKYNIGIINDTDFNANADIYIDNIHIGSFRIPKHAQNLQIERPVDVNKSFIFTSKNSYIARSAGVNNKISNRDLGIISVHVRPEDKSYRATYNIDNNFRSRNLRGLAVETDGGSHTKISKKKAENTTTHPGCTLLGQPTSQGFKLSEYMHTKGHYQYSYKLVIGNPSNNTILGIINKERYMPCKLKNPSYIPNNFTS